MKIYLPQLNKSLSSNKEENLYKFLRENKVPVASSCKGEGICGKCVISVTDGMENLSTPSELELKLQEKYRLRKEQRVSCQCQCSGDVELATTYW